MRGGAVVAHQPHKLEVAGSSPARASSVVAVTCDPNGRLRRMEVGEANRFQGGLKSLAPEQYAKARQSILSKGFFAPLFLWTHLPDGTEIDCPMILDGHQREYVVRTEGWQLEGGGYPVVEIVAADAKDAAEKVLLLMSTYGKIEVQGLYDFTQMHGIELPEFDLAELPDIDMEAFGAAFLEESGEGVGDAPNPRQIGDRNQQVKVVLYPSDIVVVEQSIRATGKQNRGAAIVGICEFYLE